MEELPDLPPAERGPEKEAAAGNARGSGRLTLRSQEFTPSAAPAWEWTIAAITPGQAQVVPATTACSS